MSVGIILLDNSNADAMIRWAARFAKARRTGLVILQYSRHRGEPNRTVAAAEADVPKAHQPIISELCQNDFQLLPATNKTGESEPTLDQANDRLPVHVVVVSGQDTVQLISQEVASQSLELAILSRDPSLKISSADSTIYRELLSEITCEAIQLVIGKSDGRDCRSILVPAGDGAHSYAALREAVDLAEICDATVTGVFVEPKVGDVAEQVGERILDRHLSRALGSSKDTVQKRVVLSNDVGSGITSAAKEHCDLILLGKQHHGFVHRFLYKSISESIIQNSSGPAIAVLQSPLPLAGRVFRALDRFVKENVPQLERDRRVGLVDKIQSSSRWNIDFVALICLSTLIAAGGLVQNSPAVVIGAMLVAPLMTPLLGTGLSLIQGNSVLFRVTVVTVLKGFLLAYLLGYLLALVVPNLSATSEMIARGSPGILDLVVALISGMAAAYAIGRPNLLSALPGVAIAASLVPPVATAGLATNIGDYGLARGSALLFLTNIIAIVLGTTIVFWMVGIRGSHVHSQFNRWAHLAGIVLVTITVGLGIYESQPANRISPELIKEINSMIESQSATCRSLRWQRLHEGQQGVAVEIETLRPLSSATLEQIAATIKADLRQPRVQIHSRFIQSFD